MNKALFLFTIGPVHAFIAQARKTRDLYAGSYLLSYIITKTVGYIKEQYEDKIKIVFPNIDVLGDNGAPNRFVAIVKDLDRTAQQKLGRSMEKYVQELFFNIGVEVLSAMNLTTNKQCMIQIKEQLEGQLEVYWVFQDFEDSKDYKPGYQQLIQNMQHIKRVRTFQQSQEPWGRKCSLNPDKNIIFVRKENNRLPHFVQEDYAIPLPPNQFQGDIDPKEGLSMGILIKRLLYYNKNRFPRLQPFPSTYQIVLQPFLEQSVWQKYGKTKNYDLGALIFDYYHNKPAFEALKSAEDKEDREAYANARIIIDKLQQKFSLTNVPSYYALVKFDGDSMGHIYAETEIPANKHYGEFHCELSKALVQFAQDTNDYVTNNPIISLRGRVVYAGGEDFLGFLPIHSLFATLTKLREKYLAIPEQKALKPYGLKNFTLSAGIVIAHVKEPLQRVIWEANKMEHYAKSIDQNKDAFAISILKRSGENLRIRGKFKFFANLEKTIKAIGNMELSHSFVYQLSAVLTRITSSDVVFKEATVRNELIRQLKKSGTTDDAQVQKQANDLLVIYQVYQDIPAFIKALQVASFIASQEGLYCFMK